MNTDVFMHRGNWIWAGRCSGAEIRIVGKGAAESRDKALALIAPGADSNASWLEQVHSATVVSAVPGACGSADGLVTQEPGLLLSVVTADCLPVVIASQDRLAVVHAGWRGLVSGVLEQAVRALGGDAGELEAWIGPAIGPCCYEVGDEVAEWVAAASDDSVVRSSAGNRPHLDLRHAARVQLQAYEIARISGTDACTKCDRDRLWSYRLDGEAAGRNFCFAWLTNQEPIRS